MPKIGTLTLESNLILAPMAGVTDLPFRMLNRRFGAELTFTEMVNARSLSSKSKRTKQMLSTVPADRPLGVQLLGREPTFILKALAVLGDYKFDILDFNAACPAKKVTRRGEGASLLKEPKRLKKILKLIVDNVKVPVTVKIRTGWDKDSVNAREVALCAEDAGISGLFIHGRTKMQDYGGSVDYRTIGQVKEALKIPVIGSGDVFSPELIGKMFDETGCDGVAIARGALGNPWIFRGRERPDMNEVILVMLEHLDACIDFYAQDTGIIIFRKFFSWYTKGFRRIRPFREAISRIKKRQDILDLVRNYRLALGPLNP